MKIRVTDHRGMPWELDAPQGRKIMEIMRDARVPVRAACGGAAACGTCHVHVDPTWLDRLPAMGPSEASMLRATADADATSRLSCQLRMSPELDGLTLTLARRAGW